MRLIDKDKLMKILCQHCDSHIEMCEDCPMKELIESVPSAWISVKERLPEEDDGFVLTYLLDGTIEKLICSKKGWWERSSGYFCPRDLVTHWMPLPDAPEVEGCGSD